MKEGFHGQLFTLRGTAQSSLSFFTSSVACCSWHSLHSWCARCGSSEMLFSAPSVGRFWELDFLRGSAVMGMIVYHLFYLLSYFNISAHDMQNMLWLMLA